MWVVMHDSRETRNPLQGPDHVLVSTTSTMTSSRPSRDTRPAVPRFNSKKPSPKLAKEIESVAKREKTKVQTLDPATALALVNPDYSPPVHRPNA